MELLKYRLNIKNLIIRTATSITEYKFMRQM